MSHRSVRLALTNLFVALTTIGTAAGEAQHPWAAAAAFGDVVLFAATLGTGWLLAVRLPRNPIGWLFLAVAAFFAIGPTAHSIGDALRTASPGGAAWAYWVSDGSYWIWVPPVWTVLIWVPLHFPDGRLPSPRWRWLSRLALVLMVAGSAAFATVGGTTFGLADPATIPIVHRESAPIFLVLAALAAVGFVGTVVSLIARYRRGGSVQRAQLRWMLWAVGIAMALLASGWIFPPGPLSDVDQELVIVAFAFIPVAIAIAVLRYRLYEIDRIISRTAAYAVVTLVVVGTYALVVLLVSLLLPQKQGHGADETPPIVIALATLAAAAVFLPVLRIARRSIDRVFNRAQYDAERVVRNFGERIRNGADPHTAGVDLVGAVERTLQPHAVGIWLKDPAR